MDILESAKPENCFYCIDGSILHNILELEQKLKTISNRAFYHHASQSRNDFRNWVRDVFHEHNLANELLKAKTPAEAAAAVRRHIRKTFLAEEEIESAIRKVVEQKPATWKVTRIAVAAAAKATAAKKAKQHQQKSKYKRNPNRAKNRKLNKKQNKKPSNRSIHGKRGKKVRRSRGNSNRIGDGNGGARLQKTIKKQARQWLKWLNINPEL